MKVAVLGASPKEDRYSNKAVKLLQTHGHDVIPVNPAYEEIEGFETIKNLGEADPGSIDTVTVYMNARRTRDLAPSILELEPTRVIFNPGAENPELEEELEAAGIEVVEACTLVLLNTGQF